MKKTSLLYAAACLLSGMTLCLSSCSDDDPIDSTTDTMPWEYDQDIDETILPGNDFYEYALGEWLETATLPAGTDIYGINEEAYDKQIENIEKLLNSTSDPIINKLRQDGINN